MGAPSLSTTTVLVLSLLVLQTLQSQSVPPPPLHKPGIIITSNGIKSLDGSPDQASDPCFEAGAYSTITGGLMPMDAALNCLTSFPLVPEDAHATITTLEKIVPFYTFADLATDSPDPNLPLNFDIKANLRLMHSRINRNDFDNEFQFEMALHRIYRRLHDAHTVYIPECYVGLWAYAIAFQLYGVLDEQGRYVIKVAPQAYQPNGVVSFTEELIKSTLLLYFGAEVEKIDGRPAAEVVQEFAKYEMGQAKDLNARYNAALLTIAYGTGGQLTAYWGEFSMRRIPPKNSHMTFTLRRALLDGTLGPSENLTLPFIASYAGNQFASQSEYWGMNCAASGEGREGSPRGGGVGTWLGVPIPMDIRAVLPRQGQQLLQESSIVSALLLRDQRTGVVTVPTVNNERGSAMAFIGNFVLEFSSAVQRIRNVGGDRLILDLTRNSGGLVALGTWLVGSLFPSKKGVLPSQVRANPLMVQAVRRAAHIQARDSVFYWANWARVGDGSRFRSAEDGFFFPVQNQTFAGRTSAWSQLFQERRVEEWFAFPPGIVYPFGKGRPFKNNKVIILTNGYCGSTCSLITTSLADIFGVRTVTVGGIPGSPQQVSNFPGSQVLSLEDLQYELQMLGLDLHEDAPQPFRRKAEASFTWRQVFESADSKVPLEFVFSPSTYNLDYTEDTVFQPTMLWEDVAKLF